MDNLKNSLLALFGALFLLAACQNDPRTPPNDGSAETSEKNKLTTADVRLVCEAAEDPNQEAGYPQNEVFLYLAESKVKVADILACEEIDKADFASHQIPENAIIAVGGWWAGAGDYLYVVQEGDNFVVKKGEIFEEQEDNSYNYKTVMTFTSEGEEFLQ